jgi:hypothetical protein
MRRGKITTIKIIIKIIKIFFSINLIRYLSTTTLVIKQLSKFLSLSQNPNFCKSFSEKYELIWKKAIFHFCY